MNSQWEANGFFINLATEVIGIILTISYVNWVLQTHEKKKWKTTDERIANRLLILLNGIVSGIRSGLGISPDVIDERVIATGDNASINKEVMRVAREIIVPVVYLQVRKFKQEEWRNLAAKFTKRK